MENETSYKIFIPKNEIYFGDGKDWIMKFNQEGIFFNHERFKDAPPSEFAKAFIEIMEKQYKIKFIEKEND